MTSRQRIGGGGPGGSGGGGGPAPAGNLLWGPDFGDPPETEVGIALSLLSYGLIGERTIGVAGRLTNLAATYNAQGVALDLDGVLAPGFAAMGIEVAGRLTALATTFNAQGVAAQLTNPVNSAAFNAQTIGTHLAGSALGAPNYMGVGQAGSSDATNSLSIPVPTGTEEGDFLLAVVAGANDNADITASESGWTVIQSNTNSSRLKTFWRFAGASEPANYTFTRAVSTGMLGSIHRVVGVDSTTPINVSGTNFGSTNDPVAPSITTTVANCLKLCCCIKNNGVNLTFTPPANYTERTDQDANGLLGAHTGDGTTATRPQAAAAASGTATMDSTDILSTAWAAQHIAIAPASFTLS